MIFPFTVKYTKRVGRRLSETETISALHSIKSIVEVRFAENIQIKKNKLTFNVSLFGQGWNWSIMAPLEKGEIEIGTSGHETVFKYEIFMFRLAVIALVASLIFAVVSGNVGIGSFMFIFLFGCNWLMAVIRHRRLLSYMVLKIMSMNPNEGISKAPLPIN
jgi:hypothetical protein